MRKLAAFALVLAGVLLCDHEACAADIKAESKISQVTVFPDSALVSRSARLEVTPGDHTVVFSDIVPEIDDMSVRAYVAGDAEYKLYGARVERQYLQEEAAENVKKLRDDIQKTEDDIKMEEYVKDTLSTERDFLSSITLYAKDQMPKELLTKIPQVTELDGIVKFLDAKFKENYGQAIDTERKERDLKKRLDALKRQLDQVSGPGRKVKRSIVVTMKVKKAGMMDLRVAYAVGGASWQPLYDARADFEKNTIELVSYGIVTQTTGEEWQDAQVSLSTARPDVSGRLPEIMPWFLRVYRPPQPPRPAVAQEAMYLKSMARVAKKDEMREEDEATGGIGGPEEEYARPQEAGIAVTYVLPQNVTIRSDGTEHRFPISTQSLDAVFKYSAYPRVSNSVYLGSNVTNAKDLQLLSGKVNIFFEGDFVGQSSIDNIAPAEKFDLYLGVDESVKIKRELLEKKVDDVWIANIPSPNRKTVFKYKFTAENYKSKKITLNLFESMPVSEDEKIKVRIENLSLEPTEKDWKNKKGVWRWELGLDPKQKSEISYTFSAEHPRDVRVEGL